MKKVIALILFVGLSFVLSSCGPNSQYYKVNKTIYYHENISLVLDPYALVEDTETNDWIKGVSNEQFETFREDYRVEIEYRIQGSGDKYQNYKFSEDSETYQVVVENPVETFKGEELSYEVKIHFINNETDDLKEMINYYGVYKMVQSTIYPLESVVNLGVFSRYNLLSNIDVVDMEEDASLTDLYQFTYSVLNDKGESVSLAETTEEVDDITFMVKGTYTVIITATEILGDGSGGGDVDEDTGASEEWTGQNTTPNVTFLSNIVPLATEEAELNLGLTFTLSYTIVVK